MPEVKCVRPNCHRKAKKNGQNKGLCEAHYSAIPRGYVDAGPVRERLIALNAAGFTWRRLAVMTGMSATGLLLIRDTHETVQIDTAAAVLAIPVPPNPFAGDGLVSPVGSRRRIQALMALGWTQTELAKRLSLSHDRLSDVLCRHTKIRASRARAINDLFEELSSTPGPSDRTRIIARRKGYVPPLAWNDIDDPDEQPAMGEPIPASFLELYIEMREHLGLSDAEIAKREGIKRQSLDRKLLRYGVTMDRRTA